MLIRIRYFDYRVYFASNEFHKIKNTNKMRHHPSQNEKSRRLCADHFQLWCVPGSLGAAVRSQTQLSFQCFRNKYAQALGSRTATAPYAFFSLSQYLAFTYSCWEYCLWRVSKTVTKRFLRYFLEFTKVDHISRTRGHSGPDRRPTAATYVLGS